MLQGRQNTDLGKINGISDARHAENYKQIVETQAIDNAILEAEEEYEATGILLDAKETLESLRKGRVFISSHIKG